MSDSANKGYIIPERWDMTLVTENLLVGCKRCLSTWLEPMTLPKDMPRVNGPIYKYDCCNQCITAADKKRLGEP